MDGVFNYGWALPLQNGKGFGTYHMINGKFPLWIYYRWDGELIDMALPQGIEDIKPV